MTRHTFEDTTVDTVLKASDKVLNSEVEVQHFQNKMNGKRKIYTALSIMMGWFNFDIEAIQHNNDVKTTLNIIIEQPATRHHRAIPRRETYELYFLRMESLLYGKPWITCKQAGALIKNGGQ